MKERGEETKGEKEARNSEGDEGMRREGREDRRRGQNSNEFANV